VVYGIASDDGVTVWQYAYATGHTVVDDAFPLTLSESVGFDYNDARCTRVTADVYSSGDHIAVGSNFRSSSSKTISAFVKMHEGCAFAQRCVVKFPATRE